MYTVLGNPVVEAAVIWINKLLLCSGGYVWSHRESHIFVDCVDASVLLGLCSPVCALFGNVPGNMMHNKIVQMFNCVYQYYVTLSWNFYSVFDQMAGESVFWLLLVLTPTVSILADITIRMV